MNSEIKQKAGLIYNVAMTVVTAWLVTAGGWMATTIIDLGKTQASQGTQIKVNTDDIDRIETIGSPQVNSHINEDETRFVAHQERLEKLEAAVMVLQQTPGELKSIAVELRGLKEGQMRMEKALEVHMERTSPKPPQSLYWRPGLDLTNNIMVWQGLTNQNIHGILQLN